MKSSLFMHFTEVQIAETRCNLQCFLTKTIFFFQLSPRNLQLTPPSHILNWFKLVGTKTQLVFSAFTECILYIPILEDSIQSFPYLSLIFIPLLVLIVNSFAFAYSLNISSQCLLKQPLSLLLITKSLLSLRFSQRISLTFPLPNYISLQKADALMSAFKERCLHEVC